MRAGSRCLATAFSVMVAMLPQMAAAIETPANPSTAPVPAPTMDWRAEETFWRVDVDGDGSIYRREWDAAIVSAFLAEWDVDDDGGMTLDDMLAIRKATPGATRTEEEVAADLFGHLDLNSDLFIDTAEVLEAHAYLFRSYDGDDNGRITLAEYQDYLKRAKFDVLR